MTVLGKLIPPPESSATAAAAPSYTAVGARLPRRCFVTTGSMASFRPLLEEVLSKRFLQALVHNGFDTIEIQCGPDLAWVWAQAQERRQQVPINIEAFAFSSDIRDRMLQCRGEAGVRHAGVIIGHAGQFALSHSSV